MSDHPSIFKVIENIINNAIKYSKSTQLKISLTLENEASTEFAKLVFEDNGIGVEESHLSNLFEYLYRVDDSRNRMDGGAGLGLSMCRQIVTAHQGEISVESAQGVGSEFTIVIPHNPDAITINQVDLVLNLIEDGVVDGDKDVTVTLTGHLLFS